MSIFMYLFKNVIKVTTNNVYHGIVVIIKLNKCYKMVDDLIYKQIVILLVNDMKNLPNIKFLFFFFWLSNPQKVNSF